MSEQISLNIDLFRQNVSNLQETIEELDGKMKTNETFETTNIKPFIDDLEQTIRALELLDEYKELFQTDLRTLSELGEQIREQDERLADRQDDLGDGYRPLQA